MWRVDGPNPSTARRKHLWRSAEGIPRVCAWQLARASGGAITAEGGQGFAGTWAADPDGQAVTVAWPTAGTWASQRIPFTRRGCARYVSCPECGRLRWGLWLAPGSPRWVCRSCAGIGYDCHRLAHPKRRAARAAARLAAWMAGRTGAGATSLARP